MADLADIGLRPGWIYETLVSTYRDGRPHTTPLGVSTPDGRLLRLAVYRSRTLDSITETGAFTVGFPRGVEEIHAALLHPDRVVFTPAQSIAAPEPSALTAVLEARVTGARPSEGRTRVEAEVVAARVYTPPRLINRAEALLLEALVVSTKAAVLGPDGVRARLEECARVISKVAPGSRYEKALRELLENTERPRERSHP